MNTLYNISIWIFSIAVHIASLFNPKAKQWIKGRKGIFQKLAEATKEIKILFGFIVLL